MELKKKKKSIAMLKIEDRPNLPLTFLESLMSGTMAVKFTQKSAGFKGSCDGGQWWGAVVGGCRGRRLSVTYNKSHTVFLCDYFVCCAQPQGDVYTEQSHSGRLFGVGRMMEGNRVT